MTARILDLSADQPTTEVAVITPTELLDVRTGEIVEATPQNAVDLLAAVRELRSRMLGLVKDCEAVLLDESRKQGTKTLRYGDTTATVTGGTELAWNLDILRELRNRGLPEDRYRELVVTTVTHKVDARVAKQLEASNPAYAEVIQMARSEVPKPWRVTVK